MDQQRASCDRLLATIAFTWLGVRCVAAVAVADTIAIRNPLDIEDNLTARRIQCGYCYAV